jgi:serine/threonine protein kinase
VAEEGTGRERSDKSTGRRKSKTTGARRTGGTSNVGPTGGSSRPRRSRKLVQRHPDIEVARLLVKRGFVEKPAAVEALKLQKERARAGKERVPFLQLLVKKGALAAERLEAARDEVRKNTYICEACAARAVILAGSQSRGGACPRCGAEIQIEPATDPAAVPPREFQAEGSATEPWRGPAPPGDDDVLSPGKVLFDRYRVEAELGRGAMGVVYRARHLELDREVALKVLVPTGEDVEHQIARFRREAAAVMKLRHENIIAVHDFGGAGDLYYLTMDLVEGGDSLHRALKRKDAPMPLRRRLELLAQVCRAVGHAHARGIVHRDLKPANVLIAPDGTPRVADFGLAKDEEAGEGELTRTHDRLGTPLFMAPEQIRKGASSVDGRADVWALGVMLFVATTGRYPFRSRTVMDLYLRILREGPDWDGNRYSAPDRASAFRQGFAAPAAELEKAAGAQAEGELESTDLGSAPAPSDAKSGGKPGSRSASKSKSAPKSRPNSKAVTKAAPIDEKTEVDSARRGPDGELPKTLPIGKGEGGKRAQDEAREALPPPFAPPPELVGQPVPRDLRAVIEQALAKLPEERYPTAEALADDIERYLAGQPVGAKGPGLLRRLRRALFTKRVLAPAAVALFLLAVVLGGAAFVVGARAAAERRKDDARRRIDTLWEQSGGQEKFADFEAALAKEPPHVGAHPAALVRRGVARSKLLRFDEARADLQAAVEAATGDAELVSWARVELSAVELMTGRPTEALAAARAAAAVGTPDARALLLLGYAAHAVQVGGAGGGDGAGLQAAAARLAAAARAKGATAEVMACAVRLALDAGSPADAAALLPPVTPREAYELLYARGHLALAAGVPDEAARWLSNAREDTWRAARLLGDVKFFNGEGYFRMERGDMATAVVADQAAAALAPWHPAPLYYGARLRVWLGDLDGAAKDLHAALDRDPLHDGALDLLAATLGARAGDPKALDGAMARLTRAVTLASPSDTTVRVAEAALRLRRGEWVAAWEACDRAEKGGSAATQVTLIRAACLRLASAVEGAALRERAGEVDAEAFEARWRPRSEAEALADALPVARAEVEHGGADGAKRARALLDPLVDALGREVGSRSLGGPTELAYGAARVLRARLRGGAGDVAGAVEDLRWFGDGSWKNDRLRPPTPWPPELTAAALETYPELKAALADPAGTALLTALRARWVR